MCGRYTLIKLSDFTDMFPWISSPDEFPPARYNIAPTQAVAVVPNDGKNQTFVTPGLMVSKIKLRKNPADRLALVFGGGMQIATSTFHAYNHGLVLTGRIAF